MEYSTIEPILFKQSNGWVVYKDGTKEPIITYKYLAGCCEVRTEYGQYKYEDCWLSSESGYTMASHCFSQFNFEQNEYIKTDAVKEFQILGVDLAE